ncbi:MAG: glycosyltransferase [Rickettsiales bacterium]|nr:glycosyltransferase [Rickettsiales bacterium]
MNNLLEIASKLYNKSKIYSVDDITLLIAVRIHEFNEYLFDRIELTADYYEPKPQILLVDFGSNDDYQIRLKNLCKKKGITYHYIDDKGVFSPSIAKNRGFENIKTDLVLFNDADCFFEKDVFARLVKDANALDLHNNRMMMLNFPVYHLSKKSTDIINNYNDNSKKSQEFIKIKTQATLDFSNKLVDFVAPYSNIFFCHKTLFEVVGGYNENFRGHGSEDFEFLIRYAIISDIWKKPEKIDKDFYGPLKSSFYSLKTYEGFRQLFSLISFHAEINGYATFHLHHDKPNNLAWVKSNDWKRSKFYKELNEYIENNEKLLSIDFIHKEKNIICLIEHFNNWKYFIFLRSLGYKLMPIYKYSQNEENRAKKLIKENKIDFISIFNPYMKSHKDIRKIFDYGISLKIKPLVIERGALPNTIYYSNTVAYNDKDYININLDKYSPNLQNRQIIQEYIEEIKKGEVTLEKNPKANDENSKINKIHSFEGKKIFIPLQLHNDMAVTYYNYGYIKYEEFTKKLLEFAKLNENILFLIKNHPLTNLKINEKGKNIIIVDDINVHKLIDISDATLCYNSGVGLLSAIHNKPVYTLGNSFYSKAGLAKSIKSIDDIKDFLKKRYKIDNLSEKVINYLNWIITEKYSFFSGVDVIKKFSDRAAHDYSDIKLPRISFDGKSVNLYSNLLLNNSKNSYFWGRLNQITNEELLSISKKKILKNIAENNKVSNTNDDNKLSIRRRKLRKLMKSPIKFFRDSKLVKPILGNPK